jgi:predicted PurR-regulated permease PerM
VCSVIAALYFARGFLEPLALAGFVAFILTPLVRLLTRKRVPRVLATTLSLGSAAIVVAVVGWLFVGQLGSFSEHLPDYRANLRDKIADFRASYGHSLERASSTVRELGDELTQEHETSAAPTARPAALADTGLQVLRDLAGSLAVFCTTAAFVLLLSWIMLLRWDDLQDRLLELAGRSDLDITTRASVEASKKVTTYFRKQLLVNLTYGTVIGFVLAGVGVPNPLVWGILGGVLRFVPYLGAWIGTAAPVLFSLASSTGWSQAWMAAAALVAVEMITNSLVEPWVYGVSTGVSPLALLVSAAFWTWIWGPVGLVLSTPLTVCLLVAGKHFAGLRFIEVLVGDQPPMPEPARLYHRLLADDQDEAWEILRNRAAHEGELTAADELLLPALGFAGQAVREASIDPEQRDRIATVAHALAGELEDARRDAAAVVVRETAPILCLGARDAFDEVGARLLAAELARRGWPATVHGESKLLGEVVERIQEDRTSVVCISSVRPTRFLHLRSLCKRILLSDPEVQIVLGLWGEDLQRADLEQRLTASPRVHIVDTLAGAVERSTGIAGPAVESPVVHTKAV